MDAYPKNPRVILANAGIQSNGAPHFNFFKENIGLDPRIREDDTGRDKMTQQESKLQVAFQIGIKS